MKRRLRIGSLLLAACILLAGHAVPVKAANPAGTEYRYTYENTGNQRLDILNIALSQVGYTEKGTNDTKYGDWCGFPRQAWCAAFVSWCARQADVSSDVMTQTGRAHPEYFDIPYSHGSTYTPQPGDLFFTDGFTHTGLVWYVEGDFFYCLEGNAKFHDYLNPGNQEENSYFVMSNKRLISEHYFGTPNYKGGGDHQYKKGWDTSHPHKEYYQCSTCGHKYYTGFNHCVSSCAECLSCGCANTNTGYYLVRGTDNPIKIRKSHSTTDDYVCYVSAGEVVYVHGTGNGWAYVEYDGHKGHMLLQYLTPYQDKPDELTVSADNLLYQKFEPVTLSWNTPERTENFRLTLYRDGSLYETKMLGNVNSYINDTLPAGKYRAELRACNRTGASSAAVIEFTVQDIYTLSYHSHIDCDLPVAQQISGDELPTISTYEPQCEGYAFLGWAVDQACTVATYTPGSVLDEPKKLELYAVWRQTDATPQELVIHQSPKKTTYLKSESLDTTGLVLDYLYSDGSGYRITQGYTVTGFDPESCAVQSLSVIYKDLQTSYDVQVTAYVLGDIDQSGVVDHDDVMQLLWHINFPELFPIAVPADFVPNNIVDWDDVMQLLWHVTFPEMFPLELPVAG